MKDEAPNLTKEHCSDSYWRVDTFQEIVASFLNDGFQGKCVNIYKLISAIYNDLDILCLVVNRITKKYIMQPSAN